MIYNNHSSRPNRKHSPFVSVLLVLLFGCSEEQPVEIDVSTDVIDTWQTDQEGDDNSFLDSINVELDASELSPISGDAWPCDSPELWPLSVESDEYPVLVHFRPSQEDIAGRVLELTETSWQVEVETLGFRSPLDDGGSCGPDGRFDVFIWAGIDECYVDIIGPEPDTSWDDRLAFMVVDPFGPYGGDVLDVTVAHELNHACQAADDWWESAFVFEMTSVFVEDLVFDDDNDYMSILEDFQSHPDWSIDRDDGYETWYMYGAALYLHFLNEHYFDGDATFVSEAWRLSRNQPGSDIVPTANEPDFEDALSQLLMEAVGLEFVQTVAPFARWRWYTGDRDDGAHFDEGALFPSEAAVRVSAQVSPETGRVDIEPAPMMLGSAYVEVSSESADGFRLSLDSAATDVRWVVQAVPGIEDGSDGETLDVSVGPVEVSLTLDGSRTIILTALPTGPHDPDTRTDERYTVAVVVEPM